MKQRYFNLVIYIFIIFILVSCTRNTQTNQIIESVSTDPSEYETSKFRLNISVATSDSHAMSLLTAEDFNGNFNGTLEYYGIVDCNILVNSEIVSLNQAISNGTITTEEIIAYARIDARNNVCTELSETKNGLTGFTYQYPEFALQYVYDILEAPDGKQHLINRMIIAAPNRVQELTANYVDNSNEYGYLLDREDWGITLEVIGITPTELTIQCVQTGGQHIGELQLSEYVLYTQDWDFVNSPEGSNVGACEPIKIQQNTTSTFTVSWQNSHDTLPSGKYLLSIWIEDIYNEAEIHPLIQNYTDIQPYIIEFEIP